MARIAPYWKCLKGNMWAFVVSPKVLGRYGDVLEANYLEVAARPRSVNRAREVRDRADEPEATPETSAERAQNRHGGAPRGAVPVARDGPRFANVASRDYARDRIKDTADRKSVV